MVDGASPPILRLFCFWLQTVAFLCSLESRCCMHKTLRLYNQENMLLQPNWDTGEDASSISVERQDASVCVCVCRLFLGNLCHRVGLFPLSKKSLISSEPCGEWLMQPQGMFQSQDEASDSCVWKCWPEIANARSPWSLSSSLWEEQYMQASLGGVAALVYYSCGAKLVTAVGSFDDIPGRILVQRHQYNSFWSNWRFH